MNYASDVPRKAIVVAGITFQAPMPYSAGVHELTEGEAAALNQTYHENLRNNFATRITKAKDALKEGEELDAAGFADDFEKYAAEYEFGVKASGGGARTPKDPIEAEALSMAKKIVKDALKGAGYSLTVVGEEKIAELTNQLLEREPGIRAKAKEVVEARFAVGKISLDGLLPSAAPAAATESAEAA